VFLEICKIIKFLEKIKILALIIEQKEILFAVRENYVGLRSNFA
jgi:hypothetical protein